jgi:PAS domain S-box-containing protein
MIAILRRAAMAIDLGGLLDSLPGLVWTALPDGRLEYVGRRWLDYTGLSVETASGDGWTRAVHPDDLPALLMAWKGIIASRRTGGVEARLRRHDGVYRWFRFQASPMPEPSAEGPCWCGMNIDIDDARRAEGKLAAERRLLELMATGAPLTETLEAACREIEALAPDSACGVLLAGSGEEVIWLGGGPSQTADCHRNLEGAPYDPSAGPCSLAAALNKPVVASDLASDPRFAASPSTRDIVAQGFRSCWAMPVLSRGGEVIGVLAIWRRTPEGPPDGEPELVDRFAQVVGLAIERAKGEDALKALSRARAELAHVARVSTMGALTASIAHEVNQPLAGIITNAATCLRMLAADPPNLDGARATAQRTIRDGNRASDVIQRLRALFARKEPNLERLNLNDGAREVLALSDSELQRRRVSVRMAFADDLPAVSGDRIQLQQVILNLVLNAADAMSAVEDRPRELLLSTARQDGDSVRLSVRDNGMGFGGEPAEALFQAFHTTKPDGMGIGLSISRSIVEAHGGQLTGAPNDGPGATFTFSIPCLPDAGRATGTRTPPLSLSLGVD